MLAFDSAEISIGMPRRRMPGRLLVTVVATLILSLTGGVAAFASVDPERGPQTGGTAVTVDIPTSRYSQTAAGVYHSLALASDGTVWAWGDNFAGQLGDGTTSRSKAPVRVQIPIDQTIIQVAAGAYHSMAVASDGSLWAWGDNAAGQLGNAATTNSSVPVKVKIPDGRLVTHVAAGNAHSLAIIADGTVWAWGDNYSGQLGNGATENSPVPVQVQVPSGRTIAQVTAGSSHSLAVAFDGTLWAWGDNTSGQLGNGTTTNSKVPEQVQNFAGRAVAQVAAGEGHSVAVAVDGTAWAWGRNTFGQLGNGTTTNSPMPTQVPIPQRIAQVSAGALQSVAVTSDHSILAWGANGNGQLGNGTTTDSLSPTQVLTQPGYALSNVAVGSFHSIGAASDGTVRAWGSNDAGQLGTGTTASSGVPVVALDPVVVTEVAFGGVAGLDLVQSVGEVIVTTPPHAPGLVDVVITTATRNGAPGPTTTRKGGYTYTPVTYTATFDSQGGSPVGAGQVAMGATVMEPLAPVRAGYTFAGWYDQSTDGTLWDFDNPVSKNITLYARWVVQYAFTGLFAPVASGDVVNRVKAGSTVPVKFSLGGDRGLQIFEKPGAPLLRITDCATGLTGQVEVLADASASRLKYDAITKIYTYMWKTPKTLEGKCGVFDLNLDDGSDHTAKFQFR